MVSAENKPKKKRRHEKKNLLEAWEIYDADNGLKDDIFSGFQKAKEQVKHKCRYLNERNIVVSHHLLNDPLCFDPEERDAVGELSPSWDTSYDDVLSAKSGALQAEHRSLSQTVPDTASAPTNANMTTDLMIHKQNINYSLSPVQTHIQCKLKRSLPLIRWAPAKYRVQVTEEPVAWRCQGLASVNRKARPAESPHLWKRAFAWRLEHCHGKLASLAHQEKQTPRNGLSVARIRSVIQETARGAQMQGDHVEQSFLWSPLAKSADLLCEDYSGLVPLLHAPKQSQHSRVQRAMREEAGHSRKISRQDGGHIFHRKQGDISIGSSNASMLLDTLCQSGCQGNSESSTISHDVTLLHILQVLQSKPFRLPEVRVPRHLKVLQRLEA